jgi:hypothetical protein
MYGDHDPKKSCRDGGVFRKVTAGAPEGQTTNLNFLENSFTPH